MWICDKHVVIVAGGLLLAAMLYLTFVPGCDQCFNIVPGAMLFGFGYAVYVPTVWSCPTYSASRTIRHRAVVNKKAIGVSYGFIGSVRNLGVSIITITSGVILDRSTGYKSVRNPPLTR